jgi:hypothetical protein
MEMNVIKYGNYVQVMSSTGIYILATYVNRPFRDLAVGTIDQVKARELALEELKPIELEDREDIGYGLSSMFGKIGSFLPMNEALTLREVNLTSLRSTEYDMIARFDPPTLWKNDSTVDVDIHWEYDKNYPTRINGILWMRIKGDTVSHMYILVEGRGLLYIMFDNTSIYHIVDLTIKPDMNNIKVLMSYDSNDNTIHIGSQVIRYNQAKKGFVVDGFEILNRGFQGNGHLQFVDIGGHGRKIYLIPNKGWWKYTIFYDHRITEITSNLIK